MDGTSHELERSFTGLIPVLPLVALPQMRRVIERDPLECLANSIAGRGMLQQIRVARYLSRERALRHLAVLEEHTYATIDPQRLGSGSVYDLIVAGHRRVEAHHVLLKAGCDLCREAQIVGPLGCWSNHPSTLPYYQDAPSILAYVTVNPDPDEILQDQLAENIYVPPSPPEAALAYAGQFARQKRLNAKLTRKKFASTIGISADRLGDAIAFASLPKSIRMLAVLGAPDRTGKQHAVLPYQSAVATARLMGRFSEEQILRWVHMGMAKGIRAVEWPAYVQGVLASIK